MRFLHSYEVEAVALHDAKRVELNNFGGIISKRCCVLSTIGTCVLYFACNQMAHELAKFVLTNSSWDYGEGSVPPSVTSDVGFMPG